MEERDPYRNLRTDKAPERKEKRERDRKTMKNTSAKTNGGTRRRIGSKGERKKERFETKERRRATGGTRRRVIAERERRKESAGEMRREEEKENGHGLRGRRRAPLVEVEGYAKSRRRGQTERDGG